VRIPIHKFSRAEARVEENVWIKHMTKSLFHVKSVRGILQGKTNMHVGDNLTLLRSSASGFNLFDALAFKKGGKIQWTLTGIPFVKYPFQGSGGFPSGPSGNGLLNTLGKNVGIEIRHDVSVEMAEQGGTKLFSFGTNTRVCDTWLAPRPETLMH
jgi:hypothetical protein